MPCGSAPQIPCNEHWLTNPLKPKQWLKIRALSVSLLCPGDCWSSEAGSLKWIHTICPMFGWGKGVQFRPWYWNTTEFEVPTSLFLLLICLAFMSAFAQPIRARFEPSIYENEQRWILSYVKRTHLYILGMLAGPWEQWGQWVFIPQCKFGILSACLSPSPFLGSKQELSLSPGHSNWKSQAHANLLFHVSIPAALVLAFSEMSHNCSTLLYSNHSLKNLTPFAIKAYQE